MAGRYSPQLQLHAVSTRLAGAMQVAVNPNVRDIIGFRWSRRHDVLTHAIAIWRHFVALDRKIAGMIWKDYRARTYPTAVGGIH